MKVLPTCPKCAATAREFAQRFCEFCGTELRAPTSGEAPAVAAPQVIARLQAVEQSPEFARLAQYIPPGRSQTGATVGIVLFLVLWLAVGSFVTAGFASVGGPLFLFPLAILGFGAIVMLTRVGKLQRAHSAELERHATLVIDKRTQVEGSDSSTTTSYFVTLARRDGQRREFAADSSTFADLAGGDAGMAFLKADRLLEFRRIEI